MTIRHDPNTVLTHAQIMTLRAIEHGYGNGTDDEARIEYGHCDEADVINHVAGEQLVVLTRGLKFDEERVIWTMDVAGELTIH